MRWLVTLLGLIGSTAAGHLGLRWLDDAALERSMAATPLAEHEAVLLAVTAYVLLAAMAAAVIGSVLAWQRHGRSAGTVLLAAGLVPGIIDLRAFVVTCVLIMAGLLAYGLAPHATRVWSHRVPLTPR